MPNHSATPWQPRAHYASNTPSITSWLLDSGASHHVTTDLKNLSMHASYNGSNDSMIGDGSSLSITYTGSTSLLTTHNTFQLNNVLYVLAMKKNFILISQFCTSNIVSIEFLPTAFLIKDIHTGATLLKGQTKDGIYEWPLSPPLLAFSSTKTTLSEWHKKLRHPTFHILKQIVSQNNLDFLLHYPITFYVMFVLVIKVTNYHSLNLQLSLLNPLKLYFLIFGLLQLYKIMD